MTNLRRIISAGIKDEEVREYPVRFINKEHVYYYKVYRDVIGEIPKPENGEKECSACGAGMLKDRNHCRVCGGLTVGFWSFK